MSEDLIQRVTKVIATSKRIPLETVTIDSEFVQLGIDSMDAVEILFALEGEFEQDLHGGHGIEPACHPILHERFLDGEIGRIEELPSREAAGSEPGKRKLGAIFQRVAHGEGDRKSTR